jgi:hypothetical protein
MAYAVYAQGLVPQQASLSAAHPEFLVHGDWFDSEEKKTAPLFSQKKLRANAPPKKGETLFARN